MKTEERSAINWFFAATMLPVITILSLSTLRFFPELSQDFLLNIIVFGIPSIAFLTLVVLSIAIVLSFCAETRLTKYLGFLGTSFLIVFLIFGSKKFVYTYSEYSSENSYITEYFFIILLVTSCILFLYSKTGSRIRSKY